MVGCHFKSGRMPTPHVPDPKFGPVDTEFVTNLVQLHEDRGCLVVFRNQTSLQRKTEYFASLRVDLMDGPEEQTTFVVVWGDSPTRRSIAVLNDMGRLRCAEAAYIFNDSRLVPSSICWAKGETKVYAEVKGAFEDIFRWGDGWCEMSPENNPLDMARIHGDFALIFGFMGKGVDDVVIPAQTNASPILEAIKDDRPSPIASCFFIGNALSISDGATPLGAWWKKAAIEAATVRDSSALPALIGTKRPGQGASKLFADEATARDVINLMDAYCRDLKTRREVLHRAIREAPLYSNIYVEAARVETISFQWEGTPVALQALLGGDVPGPVWRDLVRALGAEFGGKNGRQKADRFMTMHHRFAVPYKDSATVRRNLLRLRVETARLYDLSWHSDTAALLVRRPSDVDDGYEAARVCTFVEVLAWGSDLRQDANYFASRVHRRHEAIDHLRDHARNINGKIGVQERAILAACWLRLGGSLNKFTSEVGIGLVPFPEFGKILIEAETVLQPRNLAGYQAAIEVLRRGVGLILNSKNERLFSDKLANRVVINYLLLLDEVAQENSPNRAFLELDKPGEVIRWMLKTASGSFEGLDFLARMSGFVRPPSYNEAPPLPKLATFH